MVERGTGNVEAWKSSKSCRHDNVSCGKQVYTPCVDQGLGSATANCSGRERPFVELSILPNIFNGTVY